MAGLRVLVACDWFLKYAAAQVVALQGAGAEAALLCRDHSFEFGGSTSEREHVLAGVRDSGARVLVLEGRITDLRRFADAARLRREIRAWAPDAVHVHENVDPRLLWICRGRPTVVTVHDPTPHPGAVQRGPVKRFVQRQWLQRSAAVVVHGEELRREFSELALRPPAVVIPHGAALSPAPLPPPATPSVLFFGRLQPYKGLHVLLRAMQHVWASRPDVELAIFGEGPEAAAVPDHPKIRKRIGYIPESDLDDALAAASLVVLHYVQASQSGVGMLALARGIPVVVTETGSLPDLALDPTFVVAPADAGALADALLEHIDHDARTREAVLRFAHARFSWHVVAQRSIGLYRQVTAA